MGLELYIFLGGVILKVNVKVQWVFFFEFLICCLCVLSIGLLLCTAMECVEHSEARQL